MKKTLSILLIALLMLTLTATALADDSSVTYVGGAEKFVFISGDEQSGSDIFGDGFKGVMPGDTVSQKITVKNTLKGNYYVKIYVKAVPVTQSDISKSLLEYDSVLAGADKKIATMEDFLKQLSMTVKMDGKEIYNASPDELDGLSDWVLLGKFAKGDEKVLTVDLEVPLTLGNEYAHRAGEVSWVFKAEEIPYTPTPGPDTGDNSSLAQYAVLFGVSAAAFCTVLVLNKKKKA